MTNYVKYPKTFHLPWSESIGREDKILSNVNCFMNKEIIISEKLDGENSSLYRDYFHARSINGNEHLSQSWIKNFHSKIKHEIPDGWRICGENLYAKHSIKYSNLKSYFQVFSIWDENNNCLSWDDTVEYCELLNLKVVPLLFRGIFNEQVLEEISKGITKLLPNYENHEGYVIRITDSFSYSYFKKSVAKYVRKDHVMETVHNWRSNWYDSPEMLNNLEKQD